MMSAATIAALTDEQSRKAKRGRIQPSSWAQPVGAFAAVKASPWLGDYLQSGWRRVTVGEVEDAGLSSHEVNHRDEQDPLELFVDKSGWGSPGEPALTVEELETVVDRLYEWSLDAGVELGSGIVEEGQFQCYLGIYARKASAENK